MEQQFKLSLLERYGWVEAYLRCFFEKCPIIKQVIKKHRNKKTRRKSPQCTVVNPQYWIEYKEIISKRIQNGDIILVHSSIDGLNNIGVSANKCMDFLKSFVINQGCTLVMPCFPITNLKLPTDKSRPYDSKKTFCWTGVLPNLFLTEPACIRTRFPYNSLAAIGPKAEEMMIKDLDAKLVYDQNSAWRYCYEHHAKILFLGVKASISNTMAIHMLPDLMGNDWPIKDWYEEKNYKVKIDDKIIDVPITVQRDFWYKFVMEERTSGYLKEAALLEERNICGCNLGFVMDCQSMLNYLMSKVKKGNLTYLIPKKYYNINVK